MGNHCVKGGLLPIIHAVFWRWREVGGRVKPGHHAENRASRKNPCKKKLIKNE
jgi:hypothetical protein